MSKSLSIYRLDTSIYDGLGLNFLSFFAIIKRRISEWRQDERN